MVAGLVGVDARAMLSVSSVSSVSSGFSKSSEFVTLRAWPFEIFPFFF